MVVGVYIFAIGGCLVGWAGAVLLWACFGCLVFVMVL